MGTYNVNIKWEDNFFYKNFGLNVKITLKYETIL